MKVTLYGIFILLTGCSYKFVDRENEVSLGIPFIKGDVDGALTKALTQELSSSCFADFRSRDSRYILQVALSADAAERVGFRYDRKSDGQLKPNIIGTETRKTVTATVEVVDTVYEKVIFGPKIFTAEADFDYVDSDNVADMSFISPSGERVLAFNYSLGQLNTIEGATDSASPSIYRLLSKKIADELGLFFEQDNE